MIGLPLLLAVGVNSAVRVRPEPLMALKVPPEKMISPEVPFHVKLVPGSSLNVKVMVAVSPALNVVLVVVTATVGTMVSMLMTGVMPADPLLPAKSI